RFFRHKPVDVFVSPHAAPQSRAVIRLGPIYSPSLHFLTIRVRRRCADLAVNYPAISPQIGGFVSKSNYIPDGLHTVNSYLVGLGTARLMDFFKQAFDAQEIFRMTRPDGTIGHASMRIGDTILEMADPADQSQAIATALHFYVPNADEVYRR